MRARSQVGNGPTSRLTGLSAAQPRLGCYPKGRWASRKIRNRESNVWQFRFYEPGPEGTRVRRTITIGSVKQYPNRREAMKVVEALRLKINCDAPAHIGPITVGGLVEKYIGEELPERHSTRQGYLAVLRRWIKPRWGEYRLPDVKAVAVEQWLRSLELAPKTKVHIRNLMHLLYENAPRWELADRNPIELVRQSGRRLSIPRVLRLEEVQAFLAKLEEPYRTMVLVAVCLGLRVSEIMGLQWGRFRLGKPDRPGATKCCTWSRW